MTRDPEAAERLARRLLWAFGDSPLAAEAAALIRAQAAEIARHPAALQEARNTALRKAASEARDCWQHGIEPVRYENHILALIDTPAPPAEPAGDALRELREAAADVLAQVEFEPVKHPQQTRQRERLRAALAAAPAPIQPDADEREAMVYLIECTLQEHPAQHESAWHRAHYVADALLEAGWTRKREEG